MSFILKNHKNEIFGEIFGGNDIRLKEKSFFDETN